MVVASPRSFRSLAASSVAGCALALTALGCDEATHVVAPSSVPAFRVDVDASEVHIKNASNADDIRKLEVDALDEMVKDQGGDVKKARFKTKIEAEYTSYAYLGILELPLFVFGAMGWLPLGNVDVNVELTMDIDGQTYTGKGHDARLIKFVASATDQYLNWAVWNATQSALVDAASKRSASRAAQSHAKL